MPDYCPGIPQSSSMPVCWGTRGVEVTSSCWTWWALCILFTVAPSSTGCCLRLTALQQRPVWQHRTQPLGRGDGERSRGGAELPSALRRQTVWWGRRWLSSWPGEVILLPSRVVVQEWSLLHQSRGWQAGVQGLRQSACSRWAGEGRRRGVELPSDTESVTFSTLLDWMWDRHWLPLQDSWPPSSCPGLLLSPPLTPDSCSGLLQYRTAPAV